MQHMSANVVKNTENSIHSVHASNLAGSSCTLRNAITLVCNSPRAECLMLLLKQDLHSQELCGLVKHCHQLSSCVIDRTVTISLVTSAVMSIIFLSASEDEDACCVEQLRCMRCLST